MDCPFGALVRDEGLSRWVRRHARAYPKPSGPPSPLGLNPCVESLYGGRGRAGDPHTALDPIDGAVTPWHANVCSARSSSPPGEVDGAPVPPLPGLCHVRDREAGSATTASGMVERSIMYDTR